MKILFFLSLIFFAEFRFLEENPKKDLFDSTQYKHMKLKNRVFRASIFDCDSWDNGKLTETMFKRYDELSKNEIGTILTGVILVDSSEGFEVVCSLAKDEYIPEYKKLTDLVHNNGANIIGQLHIVRDIDISVEEIQKIPDLFADATLRAKKRDLMELK